jgi:tetratricopeptide (TPR) repeat protein
MKIMRTISVTPSGDKVGRNDPCFCSSGKKYKKCHLLKQAAEELTLPQSKSGWISKLLNFATNQPWYADGLKKTFETIFGKNKKDLNEQEIHSLSETILFEVKVKNNKTPLELFVEEGVMSNAEREVYRSWLTQGIFGAFEVMEVFLGKGMRVKRFGGKETLLISEHMGSYSVKRGNILISRALPFSNGWMFGGGVSYFLPEAMVYKFRRKNIPFDMTALEFLKLWYQKGEKQVKQHKSYEQLKKELLDITVKEEIPFDMTDFDERIKSATNPTVFFYPVYKATYGYEALGEKIMNLTMDIWSAVHYKSDLSDEDIPVGQIETALMHDFMNYCRNKFEKEDIIDPVKQLRLSIIWKKEWLDKPQKALQFYTPKEMVLKERQERGEKKMTLDFNSTAFFSPKRWEKATTLHEKGLAAFRNNDFQKARQYFNEVIDHYSDFPFIFRSIANLGMAYIALGDKEQGLRLLKQAQEINPNYRFAREHYERIQKIPTQRIKKHAEAIHMDAAMKKLLGMVQKAKERKRPRGVWVKKKGK